MVNTYLEANGREYWETGDENIERLQELYAEVDNCIGSVQTAKKTCINYLGYYIITLLNVVGYPCRTIYRNLLIKHTINKI